MGGNDRLVEQHLDLARKAAAMVYPRVKDHVEFEDLVALGQTGLVEAASRYDATRGASFATFAWYRVQGAIIDGLRRQTTLPRRVWAKLVALRAASDYLETQAERERGAGSQGLATTSTTDALTRVHDAISAIRTMYVTSLDAARERGFDAVDDAGGPEDNLRASQLSSRLRKAIDSLPERERALLTKHYWEGKNLVEAGSELGISKSWASRIHAQAVDRLRGELERDE
ncbi:MAG TPA: sigma-70 family RNA polymerase sigma factor [Kofleriaceae bacterium]|nr:sigma-70 family RNA polymerase sigma factor [Kofleriaceae bacterium]